MIDSFTLDLSKLDAMIANAPEDETPDPAAIALEALNRRRTAVLSDKAGWPAKMLCDVLTTPLCGRKWLSTFDDALRIIQNNGIVVLHGNRGPGKTRMAAEIAVRIGGGQYLKAMGFFRQVRATYGGNGTEQEVIDDLVAPRLLVIDEMQERGGTPYEDRLLTDLVDSRYAEMRPTIIIANLGESEISPHLGPSICDRIAENGAVICCDWPSFRREGNANMEARHDGAPQ